MNVGEGLLGIAIVLSDLFLDKQTQSASRGTFNVGLRQIFWSIILTSAIGVIFFVLFVVIGLSGITAYFKGNEILAIGFSGGVVVIALVAAVFIAGWSSKRAVGVH